MFCDSLLQECALFIFHFFPSSSPLEQGREGLGSAANLVLFHALENYRLVSVKEGDKGRIIRVSFQRSDKFLIKPVEICRLFRPMRVVKL